LKQLFTTISSSKIVRFGAVGGAGFFINAAALALAKELLHLGDYAAWVFAFMVAVTFTWWGNRTFTFHEHKSEGYKGMLAEWARFVATNSFGAAANFAVYAPLVYFKPWPLSLMPSRFVAYIALFFGVLVGLVFNFTLSKKLVFRRRNVTPPRVQP